MPKINVGILGAGAVGSKVAEYLASEGVTLYIFDDDKVESKNIGSSAYSLRHVGKRKVNALAEICVQRGAEAVPIHGTINGAEDILRHDLDIVIDGFDNPEARLMTHGLVKDGKPLPTLHVGVGTEGNGIAFWDKTWKPPTHVYKRGDNPICTSGLGKRLIFRTALRAAEIVEEWVYDDAYVSETIAELGEIG